MRKKLLIRVQRHPLGGKRSITRNWSSCVTTRTARMNMKRCMLVFERSVGRLKHARTTHRRLKVELAEQKLKEARKDISLRDESLVHVRAQYKEQV